MNRREHGTFIVEFAIIAAGLFILLFAVIELSRLIYIWNTINEATRRGARVAAVCPISEKDIVKRATVFGSYNSVTGVYSGDDSAILSDLDITDVNVTHFAADGVTPSDVWEEVSYVRVSIDYDVTPLIPFFETEITLPTFETTLPAESLGFVPDTVNPDNSYCSCFGSPPTSC